MKPEKARGTPQGFLESLEFCKKPWKSERGYGINKIVIVRKQFQGKTLVIGGIMPDQYFERWNPLITGTEPAGNGYRRDRAGSAFRKVEPYAANHSCEGSEDRINGAFSLPKQRGQFKIRY